MLLPNRRIFVFYCNDMVTDQDQYLVFEFSDFVKQFTALLNVYIAAVSILFHNKVIVFMYLRLIIKHM